MAFSSVQGLLFAQYEHHVLLFFTLLKDAFHSCLSEQHHDKGDKLLLYVSERHSPFLLKATCLASSIVWLA